MESIKKLLHQVRRKQLLLCAYPASDGGLEGKVTLADASQVLNMGSAECLRLIDRLHRKQLIERIPTDGAEPLVLTPKGRRLVHRMSGPCLHPHPLLE